jgi:HSP20 family protein
VSARLPLLRALRKRLIRSKKTPAKNKQPSVEGDAGSNTATPATEGEQQVVSHGSQHMKMIEEAPKHKYWVSERSSGEFHRSFSFSPRVDPVASKGSPKNGIFTIIVPMAKAKAPQLRKVHIELAAT